MATSIRDATLHTPKVLVQQQLAASETTQYTAAAANWVKITSATLTNTNVAPGAAVVVSLSVVKTGNTAGASSRVLSRYSLAADTSTVVTELIDVMLGPGDFISALAGTASVVSFVVTGVVSS